MGNSRKYYGKKVLTIDEQVSLLKKRGLCFPYEKDSKEKLEFIGYYRLSSYFKSLRSQKIALKRELDLIKY